MKAKIGKAVARRNTAVAKNRKGIGKPKGIRSVPYFPAAKGNSDHLLMTTLAVGAAGVLGYFGWEFYKKKKEAGKSGSSSLPSSANYLPSSDTSYSSNTYKDTTTNKKKRFQDSSAYSTSDSSSASNYSSGSASGFPLKKGSKGEKVRQMQQALISKYGTSILPKYGADGDFGSETAKALKKAGLPATMSESAFNVLVGGNGSTSNASSIAEQLHEAASNENFPTALNLLKKIDGKGAYEEVSKIFEENRLGGVHQTLVNGMLNTFTSEEEKQQIRYEFLRMGLQYDGNKWSLSGFEGISLVTKVPTTIWVNDKKTIRVPAKMVLGNQVGKKLDFTLFENNGRYFLVKTAAVKHL